METGFIWVTAAAIVILALCIISARDQNKPRKLPSNLCLMAIAAMVFGIAAGENYQLVAYTLIGVGVLLGFMDLSFD